MAKKKQDESVAIQENIGADIKWPTFDQYWFYIKNKYKLNNNMKIAIKKFFEGKGILAKPECFEQGMKDFGL